ncbi:glycosyltransferase [Allohahella sp. A8]|uniref:glycosyltransferase n=1 Tax=Allohahella sp. A8 TaxID=3141461 RepID=UPI003A7FC05B
MNSLSPPVFSIVIPAFNEEKFIGKTLTRLFHLLSDIPQFEVIVVDNASTDTTAEIATKAGDIELIRLPDKVTVARARNIGWASAKTDVVVFLDADVLLTEQWRDKFADTLPQLSQAKMVTGATVSISENPGLIEKNWFLYMDTSTRTYINSANLITNKDVLHSIDGFNDELVTGEDVDFSNRAKKAQCEVILDPAFKVHHEGYPKSLLQFAKREMWHGIGDIQSFKSFLSSNVAKIACLQGLLLISGVIGTAIKMSVTPLLVSCSLLFIGNFLIANKKFPKAPITVRLTNTFLYFVYFMSRFLSPLKKR